ncbi:MAG: 16S rRNA (adenine(1518)-N(6)/adenine(1519)-N(6))-dimethyltransferase [Deltaproteobacteria bacterium]|nr:16S rRNA (adenine(1518)-N(6)/adenine(1519)-N(6))-dimethyltransferase [Deltaproteobacteria bacterium]MCL5277683.1 16S rRNA (adenine(1518)-N(6)/adenine(1519)-N(6))-dimethyltransferase [Deltaproteobacteria bacterium]
MQITRTFLREHGLLPRKSAAQYLLTDDAVIDDIVGALDVRPDDRVLEIGAGCGALTGRILERLGRAADRTHGEVGPQGPDRERTSLVSVEIDERYVRYLRDRFKGSSGFKVIRQDVLGLDIAMLFDRADGIKVVGNIPYYISGPILRMLFDDHASISDIVIMLQKEVGMRIVSQPGDRYFGLLSIMRMLHYDAHMVRHVDRGLFMPVPKVDSTVVRMHVHGPLLSAGDEQVLLGILKRAFGARRKMIKNTLRAVGSAQEIERWCADAGIDMGDRAENIDMDRWIRFLGAYKNARPIR